MASQVANLASPKPLQEDCLQPDKERLRRSDRVRQHRLADSTPSQPPPQARRRKRGADTAVADEQRAKRARQATNTPPRAPKILPSVDPAIDSSISCTVHKRRREVTLPELDPDKTIRTRHRPGPVESISQESLGEEATDDTDEDWRDILDFWVRERRWPQKYFEACLDMDHLLARNRSTPSPGRKRSSSSSSVTPSDQKPREEKGTDYNDARYQTLLATKGVFMDTSPVDIADTSKNLCNTLLEEAQEPPQNSLFRDDIFAATCRKFQNRNETRVTRDIFQLIVPSAEVLATYGATELECLIESTN